MTRPSLRTTLLVATLVSSGAATAQPGGERGRGVTLFRDARLEGSSQTFLSDVPDLARTSIGARQASSIEVPDGCVATLFSEPGYRGRSTSFQKTHDNLRLTELGNDAASSLRVDCRDAAGYSQWGGGPRGGRGRGVTLFRDARLEGASESFLEDVPDLARTSVGAREASSIDVPEGCLVTLFSEPRYRGRSTTLRQTHDNLRLTDLGNDAASSLRVDCRHAAGFSQWGGSAGGRRDRGVTLFRDARLAGASESFLEDVPDLARTSVGAREASSIDVPEGCEATLYTGVDYSGRSATFRETHDNLRLTEVGNDAAASLRVDCGQRPRRPRPGGRTPRSGSPAEGVTLYSDKDFRGASVAFRSDVRDLSRTGVGGRSASSIEVPPGCRATLFSETDFQGRSATFDDEHADLRDTPIGNDSAQSMRVDCGTRRW
jgi:hypothetical protein